MANRHFGKLADVWKHLVLDEVLAHVRPERYAETHAGSAAYPMLQDPERRYGVLGFLERLPASEVLRASAYARVVSGFVRGEPSLYPGSALQAMALLANGTAYLLSDTDPVSAADLRSWAFRLDLERCEVAERNGVAAVAGWLAQRSSLVVHVDPFDPLRREEGGPSALELAAAVADSGPALVYWYGFDDPQMRDAARKALRSRTSVELWFGELTVVTPGGPATGGDLGKATTAGTGCGVVLANVPAAVLARCEELGRALVDLYEGVALPGGAAGQLALATGPLD